MHRLPPPFVIGSLPIDPPLVLAPMAGLSHSPFRQLVASFEAPGLFFSEMLSAKSLLKEDLAASVFLKRSPVERPMAYQIFAGDLESAARGCRRLLATDAEIIDFNLACPAPEIRKRRAGAFLLGDLDHTAALLSGLRFLVERPLTVKIRLGKSPDLGFLRELAAMLESCGVEAITLHPRLISEKLKRRARWEYIGHLKSMTRLPVIGNGDVTTPAECLEMFRQTGCDGVMIGRAAVQKPWLFAAILGREVAVTPDFLAETYTRACEAIREFFPERQALGRIKEFTWYFSRNLTYGHFFASRLQSLQNLAGCKALVEAHFRAAC